MSSDASTAWGMSGVLRFTKYHARYEGFGGLFWQTSWDEWRSIRSFGDLSVGSVKIGVAEFLAALITFETFADLCSGKFTILEIDNLCAKCWWDSSRCPISPFDRCAQAVHLHMLARSVKVKTQWVSSKANLWADRCSRKRYSSRAKGHTIDGVRLKKVVPRFRHVLRFL